MHHVRFPRVFLGLALVAVLAVAAACSSDEPVTPTLTNPTVGVSGGAISGIDGLSAFTVPVAGDQASGASGFVSGIDGLSAFTVPAARDQASGFVSIISSQQAGIWVNGV